MKESLNILLLSSRMPSHSADYGRDVITSLKKAGHNVLFGFDGIEDYIEKCTRPQRVNLIKKVYHKIHFYLRKYLKGWSDYFPLNSSWARDGFAIFHPYEDRPPLPIDIVVDNLKGEYDICVVLFYHNMFTTKTYKAIYEKFHIPFIFIGIDMMYMTGGCYYFGSCRNFEHECGFCPVCGSSYKNDQTHKNFMFKKKVYDSLECTFWANSWMLDFAKKSHLFDNARMRCVNLVLDESEYAPRDIETCRKKFGIPSNKKYVFLSRYRTIARKGMDVMIDGINNLYESLPDEKRDKTLLVLIGEKSDAVNQIFKMEVMQLGFVNKEALIDVYNASTVFLCSSTDDAGPSMINQSMACGTPVIAFDAGCSPDMIDDGINGYKAPVAEKEEWGDCLKKICALDDDSYQEFRRQARIKAVNMNGLRSFSKAVEEEYMTFRPNGKK